MKLRINDVINFIAASKSETLTEAARILEISQPALSESIKRLETDLGQNLFYRSRQGIKLTSSGREFLTKANIATEALDDLKFKTETDKIFGTKSLTIGCHPTVAQYTLPKAFKYLSKKAPDYKFSLIHGLSRDIQKQVQLGIIDLAIVINPVQVPDLVIKKLGVDRVGIWKNSKKCNTEILFCNHDLIQSQSIIKKLKLRPKQIIQTESLELIAELTASGLGMGILPQRVVNLNHSHLELVKESPIYTDTISLTYRPEFGKNTAEALSIKSIKSVFD
jgi:DNA-binding transcriptional LysR family regulator